jgi:F-type H+-transporting ATPase subunit epsilon
MAETLTVDIVTPEHKIASDEVTEITVPGKNGYLGILPGHAPLISELAVGVISYHRTSGDWQHVACAWGFVEVLPNKVTILAEVAERAEDVDIERARAARERAEAALRTPSESTEAQEAAYQDLQRAATRIEVASKTSSATGAQH